jgi:hypothetical protein
VRTKQTHKDKEGEKKKKKTSDKKQQSGQQTCTANKTRKASPFLCASRDEKLQVEVRHTYIPW